MKLIFKIIISVVLLVVLFFAWIIIQPTAFLPHQKIQISLPFSAKEDSTTGMIPMGETKFHPKPQVPNGHPGIDFQWEHQVSIIASADGIITKIDHGSTEGIDVIVTNGVYELRYKELNETSLGNNIKEGNSIKKGDFIAYPYGTIFNDSKNGKPYYQIHWEFASISLIKDRFCPTTYFDSESRTRIEKIWANVDPEADQGIKRLFPNICNGDYFNKTE